MEIFKAETSGPRSSKPSKPDSKGQSIIEILVAVAVGALLVVAAAGIIAPVLRANTQANRVQVAAALGKELSDNIHVWSEADWHNILNLATTSANQYYLIASSSPFTATSGVESVTVSTATFTRYFYVDSVQRNAGGNIVTSAGFDDPSTKKVTVGYDWPFGTTTTFSFYVTRNRNNVLDQTDWSGGSGQSGPVTTTNSLFSTSTNMIYTTAGSFKLKLATVAAGSIGSWSTVSTSLPSGLFGFSGAANNSYFYVIGGTYDGSHTTSTVSYTSSTSPGALNAWQATAVLPNALKFTAAAYYNSFIYVVTGEDGSNSGVSTVYYTSSTATGALNAWKLASGSFPQTQDSESVVVNNGFIYVIGGLMAAVHSNLVYYTSSTASGDLNTWKSATNLPYGEEGLANSVAYNGFIYVIGGTVSSTAPNTTSTVLYTSSTASGALNSWIQTAALPAALAKGPAVVNTNTGYIYVVGGSNDGTNGVATVYYTSSTASGALNAWQTGSSLPSGISSQSAFVNGNYVFSIGGTTNGTTPTTTVFSAAFN